MLTCCKGTLINCLLLNGAYSTDKEALHIHVIPAFPAAFLSRLRATRPLDIPTPDGSFVAMPKSTNRGRTTSRKVQRTVLNKSKGAFETTEMTMSDIQRRVREEQARLEKEKEG